MSEREFDVVVIGLAEIDDRLFGAGRGVARHAIGWSVTEKRRVSKIGVFTHV